MKKSKILIPALGIIALSAAASVSGTVAWFTANRTVTIDGGNFAAINPSAGLTLKVTGGKNTTATSDSAIDVKSGISLRDASTNIASGALKVFKAKTFDTSTGKVATAEETTAAEDYKYNDNVVYAVTWTAEFKANGSSGFKYDLYFDGATSDFGDTDGVSKAFRVGMYTSTKRLIWAPNRAEGVGLDHIKSVDATTKAATTDTDYVNVEGKGTPTIGSKTKAQGKALANYVGEIEGGSSITVSFVAWYEGCDENCTDQDDISAATTMNLDFSLLSQAEDYSD